MESLARDKLDAVLAKFGREIASEPRRFEAAMLDACGDQFRREVAVLVAAARQGVSAELLGYRQEIPAEILLVKLTQRLQDDGGLEASAARWSVDSWALALGVVSTGDVTLPFTCPKCSGKSKVMMWLAGKNFKCPACDVGIALSADGKRFSLLEPEPPAPPPPPPPAPTPPPPAPAPPPRPKPAPAPQPAPQPPAATPGVAGWKVLLFVAAVVGMGYSFINRKAPAPAPIARESPRPPAPTPSPPAPVPAPVAAERIGIAAVRAKLWSQQAGGKELATLNRGTLLTLQKTTGTRLSVRTAAGVQGWIEPTVVVPAADLARLGNLSCSQYIAQRKGEGRVAALLEQARGAQGSLDGVLTAVTARSGQASALLDGLEASRRFALPTDAAAATWYNWSARYAEGSDPPDPQAARDCSHAAVLADPASVEPHQRLALNAFRMGDNESLRTAARVVPYLAPKNATTWAIVGFAAASDPAATPERISGAFVQLFKVTTSRAGSIKWLNETAAKSNDPRLRTAIDAAIRETDPEPRVAAPVVAPPTTAAQAAAAAAAGAASAALDAVRRPVPELPRPVPDPSGARSALGLPAPTPVRPMAIPPVEGTPVPVLVPQSVPASNRAPLVLGPPAPVPERPQQRTDQALRQLLQQGEAAMALANFAAAKVAARTALSIAPDSAEAAELLQRATRAEATLIGNMPVR